MSQLIGGYKVPVFMTVTATSAEEAKSIVEQMMADYYKHYTESQVQEAEIFKAKEIKD